MAGWKNAIQLSTLLCCCLAVVQGHITVTSLPAVLFNGGNQSIVEGSVIWLYCEVDSVSPSLRVTWKKDNVPLEQDVPHILMRNTSNTSSSTFLLVVDNFQSSDNGTYQCTAEDGAMTGNGTSLTLTVSTSSSGSLQIITNDAAITSGLPPDNRTGYEVGDTASLNFVIGHVDDDTIMYTAPTVLWLKDGTPTRTTPTNTSVDSNGRLNTTLSFSFQESDAGVYQCVFTGTNSELFVTIPIRLDTGETLSIESVSPTAIVLRPPEKLVLEVRATGRYNFNEWSRNGASFVTTGPFQPQIPEEFPHFYEIYVHEPTTTDDLGLYEVNLVPSPGQQAPDEVDIAVISPVDPNTTIVGSSVVRVVEGGSIDISCISTGIPVPIITWKLNNQITSFSQTDVSTDFEVKLIRQGGILVSEVTSGNIASTLHIKNTQYPVHNGVYECIGADPDNTSVSSTAMITVQVEVIPEVNVTADVIRVAVGGDVTLTCTVTRGNPMIYTYTWTNVDTSITLLGETSDTLTLFSITEEEIATYRCDVNNSVGNGSDTITIEQAFPPVVSSRINPPGPVVLGSTVDLVCEASVGDLPINFTWTNPNGVSVNPTDTDGTISITLSSGDYGMYTCTAINEFGMNSTVLDVVLAVSPSVGLPSGSTEVVAGQTLILSVSISDFNINLTSISWTKDGNNLTSGQAGVTITNPTLPATTAPVNSTLQLILTVPSDSGSYVITSTNAAGSDNFTFSVSITNPVTITDPPNNTRVSGDEGDMVTFSCTARGVPVPSITWSQVAGSRIIINTTSPMTDSEGYISITSTLNISGVMRDDNGSYTCSATNTIMGSVEMETRTFTLTVNFSPSVTMNPLNSTQLLSPASLSLNCTASGLPLPTITWIRTLSNGSETEFSTDSAVVDGRTFSISTITSVMMVESVFTINSTVVLDTASYTCRATNRLGSVNSSVTAVSVFGGPFILSPMDSQQFEIHEQADFTFTCMAVGFPAPSLSFLRRGQPLETLPDGLQVGSEDVMNLNSEGLHVVTLTLTLFSAMDEDSGDFTCMASSNISGIGFISDNVTFELIVLVGPSITVPPHDQTVVAPAGVSFTCVAEGLPTPNITWFTFTESQGLTELDTQDSNISTSTNGRQLTSVLTLSTVEPFMTTAITYLCNATNIVSQDRAMATLTVHDVPRIVYPPENSVITVDQFQPATFDCSATGIPPPQISWTKSQNGENISLTSSASIDILQPIQMDNYTLIDGRGIAFRVNRSLVLLETEDRDNGVYSCVGSNVAGNGSREFQLVVQVAANITDPPDDLTITSPNHAIFSCSASGLPRPTITWFNPDSSLLMSGVDGVSILNQFMGEREIVSILNVTTTAPSNSGEYTCLANNSVIGQGDVNRTSAFLTVYVTPEVTSVYPDLSQMNYTVNEGNTANFSCTATGIPAPSITWLRNGAELNSSDPRVTFNDLSSPVSIMNNEREIVYRVTRTFMLSISRDEDSGIYECTASNEATPGMDTMQFELIVQIAANITDPPDDLTITSPNHAIFTCSASGLPRPTITWFNPNSSLLMSGVDGVSILNLFMGEREIVSMLNVTTAAPSNSGEYTCLANNSVIGRGYVNRTSAFLTVYVTPEVTSVYPVSFQMNYTVNKGNTANFSCTATGIPAPSITWLRNGTELNPSDPRVTFNDLSSPVIVMNNEGEMVYSVTRTFMLSRSRDEDSGIYICTASNVAVPGINAMQFELIVQIPPTVMVVTNKSILVTQPAPAMFMCSAMARPRPSITWYRVELNGSRTIITGMEDEAIMISNANGNNERTLVSSFRFTSTRPFLSAMYICVATNPVDNAEDNVTLTVYVNPNITSFVPDGGRYVVNVTGTVTFQCIATGVPPPIIQWYRGGQLLYSSMDTRISLSNASIREPPRQLAIVERTLNISDTTNNDTDSAYSCRATNAAEGRIDSETFSLFVQVPPVVVPLTPSQRVVANVSESAVLSFRIDNAVPPVMTSDLRWYYTASAPSGVPNFNSTDFQEITNLVSRTSTSSLSYSDDMLNLTVNGIVQALMMGDETDAGRYFLRASNPAGEDSSFIDLVVYGPPQIVGGPQDQFSINNGSSAVFVCDAIADPPHNISWSFTNSSGSEISDIISTRDTNTANNKYTINRNLSFGELTVNNVTFEDRGTYKCTASNVVGEVSAAANLTVHVIPIIRGISQPNDTLLREPVAIFCLATGYPIPTFTWQKNGTSLDENSGDRINIFSLFPGISTKELEGSGSRSGSGEGEEFESSGLRNGRECILNFLMMNTEINRNVITSLGELGIVGVLCFDDVIREDTDNYTCTISNELPQTTRITGTSNPVSLIVLEPPDPPINIISFNSGPRWIFIRWIPTFDGNRPVLNFIIQLRNINTSESSTVCNISVTSDSLISNGSSYMYNVSGDKILPFTQYRFRVVSCNVIGCGNQSDESDVRQTEEDTSSPPRNLIVTVTTESTLTITWRVPQMPNGIIISYKVSFTGRKSYNTSFFHSGVQNLTVNDVNSMIRRATVVGLTPGTEYILSVVAINGADREDGVGIPSTNATGSTDNVPPPPPPPPPVNKPEPLSDNVRTYTLTLTEFGTVNGPISHYHVVVVILPQDQTLQDLQHPDMLFPSFTDLDKYSPELCDQNFQTPKAYITAEFGQDLYPTDKLFIVGADDDDDVNSPNDRPELYTNGVLCYSGRYTFFIRAYPESNLEGTSRRSVRQVPERQYNDFTSTQYYPTTTIVPAPPTSSSAGGLIAGVVIGIFLAISVAVIIVIIIIIMKRRTDIFKSDQSSTYQKNGFSEVSIMLTDYAPQGEGSDVHQPIPLPALAPHVERMHLNENCGFGEEYRIIQDKSPKKSVENCILPENKPRNRYANIQCFDETRVVLKPVEGAEHDYINASFIDGYNRKKEYIASQGPLPDTVGDFWRMIWEYNVPTVVMLTNLVEKMKVKCSQYWPDSGSTQYNNIEVTLVNTITHADYIIRRFHVKEVVSGEMKKVCQYHFISWPDFGVPRHATPLLYFLQRIRNVHKYSDERPLLIHCSAGVGRTGSLITIDIELQRVELIKSVNPFNTVLHLRQQRNYMVQTEAQYVFLHDAILEGASSGRTEIEVDKLNQKMKELETVDEDDESGFKKEFQLLRQFKVNVKEFADASDDANKFKNRLANALPYNYNRVHLQMSPGIGGSDYINASYIDGYTKKSTYIATQGPMSNTVEDFWRMIYEKKVSVIVMLTQLIEKGKEQCAQYWPSSKESPEKFGKYLLELLSDDSYEDYLIREIKITEQPSDNSHNVKQFHFISWPENGVPTSGVGMIDLIDQVTRVQQHTGDKPIVVHCSAGIGRTGAFCSLSTAIERIKAEGVVDVFHTVKHLRTQRPHMVQNVDQYVFCYRAIREYVASLENYSNFV